MKTESEITIRMLELKDESAELRLRMKRATDQFSFDAMSYFESEKQGALDALEWVLNDD